ncbi:hypothetical protein BDV34DRAFT_186804 [Aspergillus parasiticus]|uniref:Uncharacterized protein n=1 Tax=Aspergillus parasiticus TaxID=5067 RepID=A0A5N6DZW7_ASPPA|nr:hypothetical protein BDV34DRAFT_186804 [Aspergillus parasiticus]
MAGLNLPFELMVKRTGWGKGSIGRLRLDHRLSSRKDPVSVRSKVNFMSFGISDGGGSKKVWMVLKQATRGLDWYSLAIGRCDMSDFGPRSVMYQSVCLFFAFYSFFFSLLAVVRLGGVGLRRGCMSMGWQNVGR